MANYSWDFLNNNTSFMRQPPETGAYFQSIQQGVFDMGQAQKQRKAMSNFQNMSSYGGGMEDDYGSMTMRMDPLDSELGQFGWQTSDPDMVHKELATKRWKEANPNGIADYTMGGGVNEAALPSGVKRWLPLINEASSKFGVPASHLAAIMTMESNGDPNATSVQGAKGLMQLMPFNIGGNAYDPKNNVYAGAALLAREKARYGSWDKAAAAYLGAIDNAGNITGDRDALGTSGSAYVAKFKDLSQKYAGLVQGAMGILAKGNKYIGTPYVMGGGRTNAARPNSIDCSAFTSRVWSDFTGGKVKLTPYTDAQFDQTYSVDQPRIGDLVFYLGTDESQPGTQFPHVAIYAGGGRVLDASTRSPGGVQYRPLQIDGYTPIFRRPFGV